MPAYLAPGAYVEEAGFGATVEGVATGTAGFVGPTERGPRDVTGIAGWEDFVRSFGAPAAGSHMHDAVRGYFANGGREAVVARTGSTGADDLVAGVDRMTEADGLGLLVVPDQAEAGSAVAAAMAERCERRGDRIAVLSAPRDDGGLPPPPPDSPSAAAYHPWIVVADPDGGTRAVPPAGHVAGVIARTDAERGVHAAPAGVPLLDTSGPAVRMSTRDAQALVERRINAIVTRGIPLVWGARTASTDPEWRYLNVRRLVLDLQRSIAEGTRWAAFEPDDEPLWSRVRAVVGELLHGRWRDGALAGRTAAEAWFVRCDRSTMTQADIDAGRLVVLVGVAPIRPAEFVMFRIGQWTAQPRLAAFPFLVAIDGVATAGFAEITGLPATPEEGGGNVLRMTQGLTAGPALTEWAARALAGEDVPGDGTVVMRDDDGRASATWRLHRMRPSALAAAGAASAGGDVVVDLLELV